MWPVGPNAVVSGSRPLLKNLLGQAGCKLEYRVKAINSSGREYAGEYGFSGALERTA